MQTLIKELIKLRSINKNFERLRFLIIKINFVQSLINQLELSANSFDFLKSENIVMINENVITSSFNKNSKSFRTRRNKFSINKITVNTSKFIKKRNEKSFSEIIINRIKIKLYIIFRRFQAECKFNIYDNHSDNECFNYLIQLKLCIRFENFSKTLIFLYHEVLFFA